MADDLLRELERAAHGGDPRALARWRRAALRAGLHERVLEEAVRDALRACRYSFSEWWVGVGAPGCGSRGDRAWVRVPLEWLEAEARGLAVVDGLLTLDTWAGGAACLVAGLDARGALVPGYCVPPDRAPRRRPGRLVARTPQAEVKA